MTIVLADLILVGLLVLNIGFLFKTWDHGHRISGLEHLIAAFVDFMDEAEDE